ncbi:hypothetical protein [Herpetosiphon gulosus]|uniref:DUF11 domain-containing protein n=1 Tax=Herpetosiphon gulosus TaxID=1973496 RepID=A0ABP9WVR1_9CHLR
MRRMVQFLAIVLLVVGGAWPQFQANAAQSEPVLQAPTAFNAVADDQFWNNDNLVADANNKINAITTLNNDLFVGGLFSRVGGIDVARVARWNGERWFALGSGISGANAKIEAIDASSSGNIYAVGEFGNAGGVAADSIARWNIATQQWSALATNVNGSVDAVVVVPDSNGDIVYVGGSFTNIDGVSANRVARWTNGTWSALADGVAGTNAQVFALSFNPSNTAQIVAGGVFTSANGLVANNIALWDGNAWQSLGTGANNGVNGRVRFVDFRNSNFVVVGGGFTSAGVVAPVGGSAAWRGGNTWEAFTGRGFNPIASNSEIRAIAELPGRIFVGGNYFGLVNASGQITSGSLMGLWNGTTWQFVPNSPFKITQIERIGTTEQFFVTGESTNILNPSGFVSLFIPTPTGSNQPHQFLPLGGTISGPDNAVFAVHASTSGVFVGGEFNRASDQAINNIALFNPTTRTWSALFGKTENGTNDTVRAIAPFGSDQLIVAGDFSEAGGINAAGVAKWDIGDQQWFEISNSINGSVRAIAVNGSEIVIGGDFTQIDGTTVNHIARSTNGGNSWSALGTGIGGPVHALVFRSGTLFAGGDFSTASGVSANNIARWNGTAWQALRGGTDDIVFSLAVFGTQIAVGGSFNAADGVAGTSAIALVHPTTGVWSPLAQGFGIGNTVQTLAVRGTDLYAAGTFFYSQPNPTRPTNIARWDGTAWQALGSGISGGPGNADSVKGFTMSVRGDDLFVGGTFDAAGGKSSKRFAQWTQPEVDLVVGLRDSADPVQVNTPFQYNVGLINQGTITSTNVIYEQTFDSSVSFGAITPSQGTCSFSNATTLRCTLGTLMPSARATVVINVTPTQVKTILSRGTVSSPADEPITANNQQQISTQIIAPGNPVPTITSITPNSFVQQALGIVQISVSGTGFVASSKVFVDGIERPTTFLNNVQINFSIPANTTLGNHSVIVRNPTPGGGDSNSVNLAVLRNSVGFSSITPDTGGVDVGWQTTFTISWTHTTDPWRIIDSLDLRLVNADGIGLWARFTEGVSGTFSLLNSEGDIIGTALAETPSILSSDTVELDVEASSFAGSGPTGFSMNVTFNVTFNEAARGRYNIELYASDDHGVLQGPDVLGTFDVGIHQIFLPMTIK